ncbi:hypothetical protein CRUP_008966, partial [Coryphaenoides rupestris]
MARSSLVSESPLLLPLNKEQTIYDGFLTAQLKHLLRGYQHIVKQEVALRGSPESLSIPPPQYYSQLITEMETLGWDKLLFIDSEFRMLRLKASDSSERQHILTVKLKARHPQESPECSADV